jgi:hypothetical protein
MGTECTTTDRINAAIDELAAALAELATGEVQPFAAPQRPRVKSLDFVNGPKGGSYTEVEWTYAMSPSPTTIGYTEVEWT